MNRAVWLKMLIFAAVSLALAGTPECGFAQRGSAGFHGGGGGFHGGGFGGGSAFHGGGFGGSFHNGGFGFHGGNFGGFHGGFGGVRVGWGYPGWWGWGGWGWGWGLNISSGWPYWGWGYPYYSPWWGPYAYSYPDDPYYYQGGRDSTPDQHYVPDYRYAPDQRVPDYRHDESQPDDQSSPAKPSTMAVPGSAAEHNYVTRNSDPRPNVFNARVSAATRASNFELATSTSRSTSRQITSLRPEVQNAIRLLRAMPPAARQERINSGRYAGFSPEERTLLNIATESSQEN